MNWVAGVALLMSLLNTFLLLQAISVNAVLERRVWELENKRRRLAPEEGGER